MILSRLSTVAIAALLSISSPASAADSSLQLQTTGRRHLKSNKNIAQQIKDDKAKGIKSKLTIEAKKAGGPSGQTSSFKVHLVDNAVQPGAKVITNTGETHVVGVDEIDDMLVTDDDSIGLIAVKKNGKTHGIIVNNKPEANTIISQDDKAEVFAYDAPTFEEPEWKCSSPDHKHDIHEPEEPVSVSELGGDGAEMIDRHLSEHHHHHDDHDHSHHHHDHGHLNVHNALDDLRRQLRGSSVRLGKKQRVLQTGAPYEYQVDVYVEVDQELCNTQGDTTVCPGTATENYVNAIFTGANTVYEPEIHTHLNVIAIAYTDLYDVATGSSNALDIMRANFATAYGTPFHYEGADLHHALLGKGLGGGIAYVGVLCRPDYGYGLSASLTGSYTSMDAATVWDMKVFTHELGHNFGSGHTHDNTQYEPVVDSCGDSCPATDPAGLESDSATIMSYCHQCSGGYSNIEYTFGGKYVSGDRMVASSYSNVPLAGSVTNNAKRVNVEMYNHVRTMTDSTFPGCLDVTPKCQVNSDCPDEACSVNVCTEYGTCELQAPSANCCGNGVCDGQEDWQSCPQDGCSPPPGDCSAGGCPTITTEFCSSCNGGVTNMFKVTAIADLVITRLTTLTYAVGSGSVKVFGKSGDYTGSEYNAAAWTQHYSGNISVGSWSQVALPRFTDTIFVPAGSSYSFYVSSTLSGGWNMLFTAGLTEDTVFTQNSDMQVYVGKGGTCVSPGDEGCGMYAGGVLFNGVLEYSTVASSTPNPTDAQVTPNPVTSSPITSSPVTPAPNTGSPVTPSPVTPGPTEQPVTPAPVTSNPTNPPSPPPSPPPTPAPTPEPTPFPVTSNPTNLPTPPPSPPPTPAPTTDAPVTSAPSNPPTLQPTPNPTLPPTPPPSPPPTTPAPTDQPVLIVVNQLCIKDSDLSGADICTDGSTSGTCDGKSEGSNCGGGGLKCRFESCVGGPGPATTTGATTTGSATTTEAPPATTTEDPGACGARRDSCSTGGECCSGSCSIDRKGNGKCA